MKIYFLQVILFVTIIMLGCTSNKKENNKKEGTEMVQVEDIHSFAKPREAVMKHLDLDIKVDFDSQKLAGIARVTIETANDAEKLILDTKELKIKQVTLGEEEVKTSYTLGKEEPYKGKPLIVDIKPDTKLVNVYYETSKGAEALQWLSPTQTAGGKYPFLFTQSQAILARSWIPLQDSPGIRFTYTAKVQVPSDLMALMSAENPKEKNTTGKYSFKMQEPIPAYLMALAVGDVVFQPIGERTGVYAEPAIITKAAYEFGEMENMLTKAEKLYGPYRWGRYDLLVLPPSFPFGGMENPRLTFATPTILAGDRSLTSLVAHELAHSWSGNLVTNATWNDFWLNEGFTVYFEGRIMEALYGKSYAEMLAELGQQDLHSTVDELMSEGKERATWLKLDLKGENPDDGVTNIAYEKGAFFLRALENKVGREAFDSFLNKYFSENAFKTMTTEAFIKYLNKNLFEKNNIPVDSTLYATWIYGPGIPDNMPTVDSERFNQVDSALTVWKNGTPAKNLQTSAWSSHEWLHFIRHLPKGLSTQKMKELDSAFGFTKSGNSEILAAWFEHVIRNDYKEGYASLENFLVNVGRRKFLVPLYQALIETDAGKERAIKIYKKARPNYHFVSVNTVDGLLGWKD